MDLVKAHPTITLRRHPPLQTLHHYVNLKQQVLAQIPADRSKSKELFIRLLYGGSTQAWCIEHNVEEDSLPPIVKEFEQDMARARSIDAQSDHPFGAEDPESDKLQYLLNTRSEREAIHSIETMLLARGARTHAYEHDGLCFTLAGADLEELVHLASSCLLYPSYATDE